MIWTTRLRQEPGGGMHQTSNANSRHTITAICLFGILLLRPGDMDPSDHRLEADCVGIQKVDAEERELAEDDEVLREGSVNFGRENCEGVARSFGDFSSKGSLGEAAKGFHADKSNKPMMLGSRCGFGEAEAEACEAGKQWRAHVWRVRENGRNDAGHLQH